MVNGGEMGECYGYSEVQDSLMAGFWGEGMQKNASSAEKKWEGAQIVHSFYLRLERMH